MEEQEPPTSSASPDEIDVFAEQRQNLHLQQQVQQQQGGDVLRAASSTGGPAMPANRPLSPPPVRRGSLFGTRFTTSVNRKRSMGDGLLANGAQSTAVFGDVLGFAVAITLPYSRTGPKPGGMRVLYVIAITMLPPPSAVDFTPAKSWEVVKRFGDFIQFDKDLRELSSDVVQLPSLPSRTLITNQFDEHIISQRRMQFLQYLQAVLVLADTKESIQPLLARFLGLSASTFASSSRTLLESPTAQSAADYQLQQQQLEAGTAHKEAETQHGFVYKLTAQYAGLIKPTFRLVWLLLNLGEGTLKLYNAEQNQVLMEMRVSGEYGKIVACEPKDFGVPAAGAFGFSVWTPMHELILYAESAEDRLMWVTALEQLFSPRLPSNAIAAPRPKARAPLAPRPSAVFAREAKSVPTLLKPPVPPRSAAASAAAAALATQQQQQQQQQQEQQELL